MTDVETLTQRIVDDAYDGDCAKAQLIEHLDALVAAVRAEQTETVIAVEGHGIAPDTVVDGYSYAADVVRRKFTAVRAEMQEAIDTKVRAHAMAIDREFALAEEVAQLKLQLETYQAKFVLDGQEIERLKALIAEVRWFCPICGSKMICSQPEGHL